MNRHHAVRNDRVDIGPRWRLALSICCCGLLVMVPTTVALGNEEAADSINSANLAQGQQVFGRAGRIDAAAADGGDLQPRLPVIKPDRVEVLPFHRTDVIRVKFHDDAIVRLRGGVLTDLGTGELDEAAEVLDLLAGTEWRPLVDLPEKSLERLRGNAEASLGKAVADFRVWFHAFLPADISAAEAIDALNALNCVELAEPVQDAVPATPPPWGGLQPYLNSGPVGLGAMATWEHHGFTGSTAVPIVDIELGYDYHQDLPSISQIGPPGDGATQADRDHGTAVLGVLASQPNGYGTTGIAPSSGISFAYARVGGIVNIPSAIVYATDWTGVAGAIILLELQIAGPASCGNPCVPLGLPPCDCGAGTAWVPVEWDLATYNAIQYALGNDKIVVEPAGNGAQDLDSSIYSTGNNGHWPFLPQNDSGAIMVGAGRGWDYIDVVGSRICCSNYGSRVDVSGHGSGVWTTGYGNAYNAEGPGLYYTNNFAGTSSASACVAGVAALVQTAFYAANSGPNGPAWMSAAALRQALVDSGSPQPAAVTYPYFPASQNIGPMPDASIAILLATGGCVPFYNTSIGNPGLNSYVDDLISFDDGSGLKLYAGGGFTNAGNDPNADYVAAWNGTTWSAVGGGPGAGYGLDLEIFDDGNGAKLYAAGGSWAPTGGVSVWNGSTWSSLGSSFDGPVFALTVFNGSLYAGGSFSTAGGTSAANVARWNGSSWSAVGAGVNGIVQAMEVYYDGSGAALYAGGSFSSAGGTSADNLASWDGTQWSAVGSGAIPMGSVYALAVYDDGGGADLYVGGQFYMYNGAVGNNLARWDGSQWSAVSPAGSPLYNGTFSDVVAMTVFDDGTGDALFIGGGFEQAVDAWTNRIVKWDGVRYWPLADGVSSYIGALGVHDDGAGGGPALYIGGGFTLVYDLPAANIARWGGCSPPIQVCTGDLGGDGTVNASDLAVLLGAWGPNPGHVADLNNDGTVNAADLALLLGNWGTCP